MDAGVSQVHVRGGRVLNEGDTFWAIRGGSLEQHQAERIVSRNGDPSHTFVLCGFQIFHTWEVWVEKLEAMASHRQDLVERLAQLDEDRKRVTDQIGRIEGLLFGAGIEPARIGG